MEIAEIKSQLSIQMVVQHYGLEIKNKHVHCPFHEDKTPSMRVYNDTNTLFCFSGNCDHGNKVIDVIDFIMLKESLGGQPINKHQAILKAKSLLGYSKNKSVADQFYILQAQLPRSKKALEYLKARGLTSITELGSNHRNGGNQVPYQLPYLKNCIVFPLKNCHGQIVSLYGRSFTSTKKGCHYYLTDRKGLSPSYPKTTTEHLILTESIIDALTLQAHGVLPPNTSVLACFGTNGFTKEHTEAIHKIKNLKKISLFFDGDKAGRTATAKLQTQLQHQYPKLSIGIIDTPADEDINSLWVNNESSELFQTLLNEAKTASSFSIEEKITVAPPQTEIESIPKPKEPQDKPLLDLKVKGSVKNTGDSLKVTLQTQHIQNKQLVIQKLDLYDYGNLEKHAKQAAKALDIESPIIIQQWQAYALELEKKDLTTTKEKTSFINQATKNQCVDFLKNDHLLQRINDAIAKTGVVGEIDNRLLLFLIATSYHSKSPLHGLIQGSSGSGKTKLLQSIYKLLPPENCKTFTRVTESSFYNYGEHALTHKTLCFEDIDGLKEEALFALRELQSNAKLSSSTSQKQESGKIVSGENTVYGPIASLSCTTKADLYEDNISRCFVIAVDESTTQTNHIINYQNKLSAGEINTTEIQKTQLFIQNCIRVLQPLSIVNPYAKHIQLPQNIHKLRRLHGMYQNLIAQVTWWHQYQRKKDTQGRLIAQKQDLQIACEVLLETIILKVDELHGSLRQFYEKLKEAIKIKGEDYLFNRFEVKIITGLGKSQINNYLKQLVELEYLQQFGYANRGFTYKIVFWDNHIALRTKIKKDLQSQIDLIS